MDYDIEIARMKETLGLCLHSQQRLAEAQTSSSESIAMLARINVSMGQSMERMHVTMAQLEAMSAKTTERLAEVEQFKRESEQRWKHIDLTIAEIGDKLNGLIGYMDGQARKQQ